MWKPGTREQRTFHLRRGPIKNDIVVKYVEVVLAPVFSEPPLLFPDSLPDFVHRFSFNLK